MSKCPGSRARSFSRQSRMSLRNGSLSRPRPRAKTGRHSVQWIRRRLWRQSSRFAKIVLPERILETDCAQIEVPRFPLPQGTAEKIGDVLQVRDGRTRVQIGVIKAPETASQDRRVQRTVDRSSARMTRSALSRCP